KRQAANFRLSCVYDVVPCSCNSLVQVDQGHFSIGVADRISSRSRERFNDFVMLRRRVFKRGPVFPAEVRKERLQSTPPAFNHSLIPFFPAFPPLSSVGHG